MLFLALWQLLKSNDKENDTSKQKSSTAKHRATANRPPNAGFYCRTGEVMRSQTRAASGRRAMERSR